MTQQFWGTNLLSLDEKGRLALPTKYRRPLHEMCGGNLIITLDASHCLLIYPLPTWERIERELRELSNQSQRNHKLWQHMVAAAEPTDMDAQGRLMVPTELREFAGLVKKVALIGQAMKFELWNEQSWYKHRDNWIEEERQAETDSILQDVEAMVA